MYKKIKYNDIQSTSGYVCSWFELYKLNVDFIRAIPTILRFARAIDAESYVP